MSSTETPTYLDDEKIFILENILKGLDDVFLANITEIKIKKSSFSNSMIIDCRSGNQHFTHALPVEFENIFLEITKSLKEDIRYINYSFNKQKSDLFIIMENLQIYFAKENIRLLNRETGDVRLLSLNTLKSTQGLILSIINPLLKTIKHVQLNEKEKLYHNLISKNYDRNTYSSSERNTVFSREMLERQIRRDFQSPRFNTYGEYETVIVDSMSQAT